MSLLEISNLSASTQKKKLLDNISLSIKSCEIVVVLGPNGSGKTTLVQSIMGNSKFEISGNINMLGENISSYETEERAKRKIFLSFQHPVEIPGVSMLNFLRQSYNLIHNTKLKTLEFSKLLDCKMRFLGLNRQFRQRFVNSGFSGGEKKLSELLQMLLFEPKIALLDEIDSGLDVNGIKLVSKTINYLKEKCGTGFLIISHYNKLLKLCRADRVLILKEGKCVEQGGSELIERVQKNGFNNP